LLVNNILFCDEVFYLKNIPVLELKIVTIFPKDSEALFNRSSRRTFGGADVQMYLITKELKKIKEVSIYSFIVRYPTIDFKDSGEFNLIKTFNETDSLLKKFIIYHKKIKKIRPDIIIQRGLTLFSCLLALYCRFAGIKFVFMFAHDIESLGRYQKDEKKCFLFPMLLKNAYRLIVQNEYEYSQIADKADASKIKIIKKGLDLEKISHGLKKTFDAVWVGRCEPWKKPEAFIELAKMNPDCRFLMICSPVTAREEYYRTIREAVADAGNITFEGFVKNELIYKLLSQSRVFCITSEMEGDWPMTVLEAAATGLPILSLHLNYGEMLTSYKAGCLSNDILTLSRNFRHLIKNKKVWEEQSRNARNYIEKNHQLNLNMQHLYKSIS